MEKSVAKAFYIDGSYQRKNLYGREHALTMKKPGTTPKEHLVDRSSIGVSVVYGDHSNSPPVLNTKGITPILPTFDGQSSRSFVLWLCEIKCYFLNQYIPESMKCELVVSCLKEAALLWYATLNLKRKMEGKGKIRSWHKLESHMRKEFTLSPTMSELQSRGENLKQQLLNINKIAKPCTKPLPNMKSKLTNIQACHEPETKTIEQTSLKMICPHNKMNPPVCKKNLTREKVKCFHCQGVGHLRKDCPSTKTSLEATCSLGKTPEPTACVEKSIANTTESEGLLVESSLVNEETVVRGNNEDQIFMEPYLAVVVKDNVCVLPDHPKHLVESPCEEVSQVNDAHIDKDLDPTEIESVSDVYAEEPLDTIGFESMDTQYPDKEGVTPVLTPLTGEEHINTSMVQINVAQDSPAVKGSVLSTYLSPLGTYINKRLHEPLNLVMSKFLTMLDDQKSWSTNVSKQKKYSKFNCSKFPNFIPHIKHCPNFSHSCLRSLRCVLSMPHFHSYMLKRMQTILVQLSTTPYTFKTKTDQENCNLYQMPWSNIVKYFEEFKSLEYCSWVHFMSLNEVSNSETQILDHLQLRIFGQAKTAHLKPHCLILKHLLSCEEFQSQKYHCYVLSELGKVLNASETLVPRDSKERQPDNGEMAQINHHCPDLSSLCLGMSDVPIFCKKLLGTTNPSPSPDVKGFLTPLVKNLLRGTPQCSSNNPLVFEPGKIKSTWVDSVPNTCAKLLGIPSSPDDNEFSTHMAMSVLGMTHQYNSSSLTIFDPGILGNAGFLLNQQSEAKNAATFQEGQSHGLTCEELRRVEEEHQNPNNTLEFFIAALIWLLATCLIWKVVWQGMVIISILSVLIMPSSEPEAAIYVPPRQLTLVFDPGGRMQHFILELRKFFFNLYPPDLRTNLFQPGVVAAGARGMGSLNFCKPRTCQRMVPGNPSIGCT